MLVSTKCANVGVDPILGMIERPNGANCYVHASMTKIPLNTIPRDVKAWPTKAEQIGKLFATHMIEYDISSSARQEYIHLSPSFRNGQRDYVIITGPSGMGKSTAAADFAAAYIHLYRDRPIYLFSAKETDPVYADVEHHLTRIPLSRWKAIMKVAGKETVRERKNKRKNKRARRSSASDDDDDDNEEGEIFPDDSVSVVESATCASSSASTSTITTMTNASLRLHESGFPQVGNVIIGPSSVINQPAIAVAGGDVEFEKCLIIFDDVENLDDEYLKLVVAFKNTVTQLYRQKEVDVVECNHKLLAGHISRLALAECTHVVFFISGVVSMDVRNFLEKYASLPKSTISYLLSQNTRWLCFIKFAPYSFVTPEKIRILQNTN